MISHILIKTLEKVNKNSYAKILIVFKIKPNYKFIKLGQWSSGYGSIFLKN